MSESVWDLWRVRDCRGSKVSTGNGWSEVDNMFSDIATPLCVTAKVTQWLPNSVINPFPPPPPLLTPIIIITIINPAYSQYR